MICPGRAPLEIASPAPLFDKPNPFDSRRVGGDDPSAPRDPDTAASASHPPAHDIHLGAAGSMQRPEWMYICMYMYVGSNPVIRGPLLEICRRKISIQTPLHSNPRPRQSASSRFLPTPNFSTAPKTPKHHKNAPGNRNRDFTGVGARYDIRPCTRRENTKHAGTSGSRPGRLWLAGGEVTWVDVVVVVVR